MKIVLFRPFLTGLLVLVYMFVSTEGLHNHLVLCFEVNGEVNVEWTPSGLGCDTSDEIPIVSKLDRPALEEMPVHCGPCVDEPISTSLSQQRTSSFSKQNLSFTNILYALPSYSPYTIVPTSCPVCEPHALHVHTDTCHTLRTVVLLI